MYMHWSDTCSIMNSIIYIYITLPFSSTADASCVETAKVVDTHHHTKLWRCLIGSILMRRQCYIGLRMQRQCHIGCLLVNGIHMRNQCWLVAVVRCNVMQCFAPMVWSAIIDRIMGDVIRRRRRREGQSRIRKWKYLMGKLCDSVKRKQKTS